MTQKICFDADSDSKVTFDVKKSLWGHFQKHLEGDPKDHFLLGAHGITTIVDTLVGAGVQTAAACDVEGFPRLQRLLQ